MTSADGAGSRDGGGFAALGFAAAAGAVDAGPARRRGALGANFPPDLSATQNGGISHKEGRQNEEAHTDG